MPRVVALLASSAMLMAVATSAPTYAGALGGVSQSATGGDVSAQGGGNKNGATSGGSGLAGKGGSGGGALSVGNGNGIGVAVGGNATNVNSGSSYGGVSQTANGGDVSAQGGGNNNGATSKYGPAVSVLNGNGIGIAVGGNATNKNYGKPSYGQKPNWNNPHKAIASLSNVPNLSGTLSRISDEDLRALKNACADLGIELVRQDPDLQHVCEVIRSL